MEKEGNYPENFTMKSHIGTSSDQHNRHDNSSNQRVDYMLHNPTDQQPPPPPPLSYGSDSFDKLSFADVMQFADFGPKLALLNQAQTPADDEGGIDPVYFLKFPVLNDHHKMQSDDHDHTQHLSLTPSDQPIGDDTSAELRFLGENLEKSPMAEANNNSNSKSKRKRPRSIKTTEEVESQRMTHIAVERNRRKQMNEHLRVLRSLMPSSYVHRGDQASIIGGAIEFVRELEQLLQCLESQKRRRLYGDGPSAMIGQQQPSQSPAPPSLMLPPPPPLPGNNIPSDQQALNEYETGLREETAESKSCLADVEVKLLGFDALIKILSRRRDGQLIKTIAALEEMQLSILHTNITTIEQTVLYSFNVKIGGEAMLTAEDMANSVQQIFSFIHASSSSSI